MRGQLLIRLLAGANITKELNYLQRNLRGHGRAASDCFLKALKQLGGSSLFQQISAGARTQRVEDTLVAVINGMSQQYQTRIALFQQPDALNAVYSRKSDIHQHHIRKVRRDPRQRLFHRAKAARTAEAFAAVDQYGEIFT